MPKLTPLQWMLFAAFLTFFGFAVFALTRDYYLRHPVRPAVVQLPAGPHGTQPPHPRMPASSALESFGSVPETLTESNPVLLRQQADKLFVERRYAEALPVYRRILELAPDDAETHNDLGLALHYLGDSTQALQILREGAAKDSGLQRLWLTLGFVSLQAGSSAEAREALERARSLGADNNIGKEAERLLGLLDE